MLKSLNWPPRSIPGLLAGLPVPLSSLSVETTLPACSGTTSSGPFSPTQYGSPGFTGPPSARLSGPVLLAGVAAGVVVGVAAGVVVGVAAGVAAALLGLDSVSLNFLIRPIVSSATCLIFVAASVNTLAVSSTPFPAAPAISLEIPPKVLSNSFSRPT